MAAAARNAHCRSDITPVAESTTIAIMIADGESVRLSQLLDFIHIAGISQTVATHQKLILIDRYFDIVEMAPFQQSSTLHVNQFGITDGLANKPVV